MTILPLSRHSPLSTSSAQGSYSLTWFVCYFCADTISRDFVFGTVMGRREEGTQLSPFSSHATPVFALILQSIRGKAKDFSMAKDLTLISAAVPSSQADSPGLPGAPDRARHSCPSACVPWPGRTLFPRTGAQLLPHLLWVFPSVSLSQWGLSWHRI